MTTYIKETIMAAVTTDEEYKEAIDSEIDYIDDLNAAIDDVVLSINKKDEDLIMYEDTKELKKISTQLEDVYSNLLALTRDYFKKGE